MFLDCVGQLQARVESPPAFSLPFKILDNGRIQDRSGSAISNEQELSLCFPSQSI